MSVSIANVLKKQSLHPHIPVAFVGNSGSGKSMIVEEWCEKNDKTCVKILASTMDTTDVAGLIVSDASKKVTKVDGELVIQSTGGSAVQLLPEFEKDLRNGGVLFMDELNCACREVQDTLLTLVQSRQFPNRKPLHPSVQIVAAMNDSVQCNNYSLSPAMRNRFAWFEFQPTFRTWFHWARKQLPDEFNAFLFSASEGGLQFASNEEFMDERQMLFCTPRSLWNCIVWSDKDVKTFLESMKNFLPKSATTVFKRVDKAAIKDRSNAVFARLRSEIENAADFEDIVSVSDKTVVPKTNR